MADRTDRRGRRLYPEEFQREAVALADSVGINVAADRLGVPRATVGNWTRRRRKVALPTEPGGQAAAIKRPPAELEAEIARLKRELASAKLDNEILRKAAAYFARESR